MGLLNYSAILYGSTHMYVEPDRSKGERQQRTATHRAKLDPDKFGNEARDQTGGLIESSTHLTFGYPHPISIYSWTVPWDNPDVAITLYWTV